MGTRKQSTVNNNNIMIIIIITRLITHVKVIHKVKNRKCGWSHISEGKLGCKVTSVGQLLSDCTSPQQCSVNDKST